MSLAIACKRDDVFASWVGGAVLQQHRHHFHPIKVISCVIIFRFPKKTHMEKKIPHTPHHQQPPGKKQSHTERQNETTTNNKQPQIRPHQQRPRDTTGQREGEDFWQFVLVALQLRQMRIAFLDVPKAVTWKHWPDGGDH